MCDTLTPMSTARTTERRVEDLQVGDALILSQGEIFHAALIVALEPVGFRTKVTFLVQPAGETEVKESGGLIDNDYAVQVIS